MKIRSLLDATRNRFKKYCLANPSLTQGDSIEMLVDNWLPVIYTIHRLRMDGIEVKTGFGTKKIIVHNEDADECDGPAFWNARQALSDIKVPSFRQRPAAFVFERRTPNNEMNEVLKAILFLTTLMGMTSTQLTFSYHMVWEKKNVTEIAEIVETSKANVSKTLNKTPSYVLRDIISLH